MKTLYVNKKSEASMLKHAFEAAGFRCLRMKTFCDCRDQGNIRAGVIILDGDKVLLEIRRCKACFRRHNPNLCTGGVGQ
ncbi:hypothetical protein [uncultured Parabacteroides sp.]|uniref:hypothetical protein n=1 Tax=uncultured Parabacteroides sp. TaxID=512312 RepID=UPI0026F2C57E|nr:hypothetical protein [uncultured Parabacteroides sp.]